MLKRDEICPADIVILDTSLCKNRENICFIDTSNVNGKMILERKKATSLTKRNKDYKKLIIIVNVFNIDVLNSG